MKYTYTLEEMLLDPYLAATLQILHESHPIDDQTRSKFQKDPNAMLHFIFFCVLEQYESKTEFIRYSIHLYMEGKQIVKIIDNASFYSEFMEFEKDRLNTIYNSKDTLRHINPNTN